MARKFIPLAALLITASLCLFGQTSKEVLGNSETPLIYLGIDFTKAKLIGDETTSSFDVRDRQYNAINNLVVDEPKKYDLKAAFHKSVVDHDLGPVEKRNAKINTEEIKSTSTADFHRLKEPDIISLVNGFDFGDRKGFGLLFIVEAMDKSQKAAAIWVTLVDLKSKKVLLTERMEGRTSMGFGFRNYWATAVKNVIEAVEKRKFSEWKDK
jgi:hypothetical protein